MPLQPRTLGTALDENLTLHSALCRREAGAFQKSIQSGDDVVVACPQETRLFAELAQRTEDSTSVIKFVNIRETGGWSKDAAQASPKIAALLALAHLPDAEPVPTVTYKSAGRLLIIGELDAAERTAGLVSDALDVTLFSLGGQDARSLMRLRSLVGEFEKPKFINYRQKLCAHSRNEKIGCGACIDVCSAEAISSEKNRQQIVVNPNLCVGCGDCATVCPTGAIFHAYLRASEQGVKLKTLLATDARARWRCRLRRRTTISRPSFRRSRFPGTPDCRPKPHALQR